MRAYSDTVEMIYNTFKVGLNSILFGLVVDSLVWSVCEGDSEYLVVTELN
jgi:hypothetical protein